MKVSIVSPSLRALKWYGFLSLLPFIGVVLMCVANWYILYPSNCTHSVKTADDDFSYTPQSQKNMQLVVYSGACLSSSQCIGWESEEWKTYDTWNQQIGLFTTSLYSDAGGSWLKIYPLGVVILIGNGLLILFYFWKVYCGSISRTSQILASAFHLVLCCLICISIGLGLVTDTVLPKSWGVYYYDCDVYAGPGVGWWGSVIAVILNIVFSFVILFPYLVGSSWVERNRSLLKSKTSSSIHPSFEKVGSNESISQVDMFFFSHDNDDDFSGDFSGA